MHNPNSNPLLKLQIKQILQLVILLITFSTLFADEEETEDISFKGYPTPWFTGPLIAPTGFTVKPGDVLVQPYFNSFVDVGIYNSHWKAESIPNFYNIHLRILCRTGVTNWMDVQIIPIVFYKETQGRQSAGFSDLHFAFNFQLLTYAMTDPWPSIKLILQTSIPTGKYQKLNPHRKGTDAGGNGCWYPEAALVIAKLWYLSGIHFLEARLYTGYRIGVPTSIHKISVYGGDEETHGVAYPGNIFFSDAALQYKLTKRWSLACDFYYLHRDRSRFSGQTLKPATHHSTEQVSLAPAIEYNWSKNFGVIGGIWFSAIGRNTPQFINGMLSLNAFF